MDLLKKIFPLAFVEKKDVASLVINIIIQLVVGLVVGWVISLLFPLPGVGKILSLVVSLLDLYIFANIVITCLDYFKILK